MQLWKVVHDAGASSEGSYPAASAAFCGIPLGEMATLQHSAQCGGATSDHMELFPPGRTPVRGEGLEAR
jgi:hypothetical protein